MRLRASLLTASRACAFAAGLGGAALGGRALVLSAPLWRAAFPESAPPVEAPPPVLEPVRGAGEGAAASSLVDWRAGAALPEATIPLSVVGSATGAEVWVGARRLGSVPYLGQIDCALGAPLEVRLVLRSGETRTARAHCNANGVRIE